MTFASSKALAVRKGGADGFHRPATEVPATQCNLAVAIRKAAGLISLE